jgi:hypothetical protein
MKAKATNGDYRLPTRRSTTGLRDALFDEIDRIRAGTGNLLEAGAIARLAQQIVNVTRMEMEYAKTAERFHNVEPPREIMLTGPNDAKDTRRNPGAGEGP